MKRSHTLYAIVCVRVLLYKILESICKMSFQRHLAKYFLLWSIYKGLIGQTFGEMDLWPTLGWLCFGMCKPRSEGIKSKCSQIFSLPTFPSHVKFLFTCIGERLGRWSEESFCCSSP